MVLRDDEYRLVIARLLEEAEAAVGADPKAAVAWLLEHYGDNPLRGLLIHLRGRQQGKGPPTIKLPAQSPAVPARKIARPRIWREEGEANGH